MENRSCSPTGVPGDPVARVGLAPVVGAAPRVLVLGSFPGEASLAAGQYYGHPRNHFWRLIGGVVGERLYDLDYRSRLERLRARGVALWDVIAQCERQGSLDSAIRAEIGNDIAGLLRRCPTISLIAFNGGKSASYRKRVESLAESARCTLVRLPSSSPANATHSLAVKLAAWEAALGPALRDERADPPVGPHDRSGPAPSGRIDDDRLA